MSNNATVSQVAELVSQIARGKYTREEVQKLIEGKVEIIDRGGPAKQDNCYRLHVTYKLPSLEELEKKYDVGVSCLFDGRPWERHNSCKTIDETAGEREFLLAEVPEEFLGKKIDSIWDQLAEHFGKLGYRFVIPVELDAFGTAHPDLQRKNYILALGSSALDVGRDRCVAYLYHHDGKR
jgi:hypothetical protein